MRFIFIFAAILFLVAPASLATAASSNSTPSQTMNDASSGSTAAKHGKSKRKPAPKVEYMRAVPSR